LGIERRVRNLKFSLDNFTKFMKKVTILFAIFVVLNFKARAEFYLLSSPRTSIIADGLKVVKEGILLGESGGSSSFNGIYLDNEGNFNFIPKILGGFKITDFDADDTYYYALTYNTINNQGGLFKITKDFKNYWNIGLKATLRKVHQFKDKVYVGGTVHGCYVVNKDGSGLMQILGDGYFGPYIDDIKSNSNNVYVLSRGNLYKVDYNTNQKTQIIFGQRPSFIEVDDSKIYATATNKFFYLSFDNKVTNEKTFPSNVVYMKKYKNYILLAEGTNTTTYFWFSNDSGLNFYKSKTQLPADYQIKGVEFIGGNELTLYINFNYYGIYKAKLNFDFSDTRLFRPPFDYKSSDDLLDKITSYFDHRYPYLGNLTEPIEYANTTLNFLGKELPKPYIYYSSHDGIDFGLPMNSPIYAVSDGVAEYFYQNGGLGNTIQISHPNGYLTVYGHLSDENLITKNSKVSVTKGQKIGKVGMSGNTNGPHLHFTTYKGSKILNNKIDPFGWQGNFIDPWSAPSKFLWESNPYSQTYQINFAKANQINIGNLSILNSIYQTGVPSNILISKTPPIFDVKNYSYFQNSSYSFAIENFLGYSETIPNIVKLKFYGFKSFEDEKNYSIWKNSTGKLEKIESNFEPNSGSLTTYTELNADYLILKNNYQKILTKNSFKTK